MGFDMKLARKDLLGIQELSVEEISLILDTADPADVFPLLTLRQNIFTDDRVLRCRRN